MLSSHQVPSKIRKETGTNNRADLRVSSGGKAQSSAVRRFGTDLGDALKGSRHGMYHQHTIQSSVIEISSHQKEFGARFHYTHKSVSILKTPRRFKAIPTVRGPAVPPDFLPGSADLRRLQWDPSSKTVIAGLPARWSISDRVVVLKSCQIHPLGRSGMKLSIFHPVS